MLKFNQSNFREYLNTANEASGELPTLNDFREALWNMEVQYAGPVLHDALSDLNDTNSIMSQLLIRECMNETGSRKNKFIWKLIFDDLYIQSVVKKDKTERLAWDFEHTDDFFVCIVGIGAQAIKINPLQKRSDVDENVIRAFTTIKGHFGRFLAKGQIKHVILAEAILDPSTALHAGVHRSTLGNYKEAGERTERIITRAKELVQDFHKQIIALPKYSWLQTMINTQLQAPSFTDLAPPSVLSSATTSASLTIDSALYRHRNENDPKGTKGIQCVIS